MTEPVLFGLYAAARWLGYLAVFLIAGGAVVRWVILPRAAAASGVDLAPASTRAIIAARAGSLLLAVALLLRLYFQTRSLLEPDEPVTRELLVLVIGTQWGKGWMIQALAALTALIGWRLFARRNNTAGRALATLGTIGCVLASPLTGHATGLPAAGALGYPLTALHLAFGAAWLGTLGVLWFSALRPSVRSAVPALALVEAFSPLALVSGIGVMIMGGLITWRYVGTLDALFTTPYGRTLLIKVGALAGTAAIGAWNWKVTLPRLRRGEPAGIARSAAAELTVALLLLAITAVLVAQAAPGEHD